MEDAYKRDSSCIIDDSSVEEEDVLICKHVHTAPESFVEWAHGGSCKPGEKLDEVECATCTRRFVGTDDQCKEIGKAHCYRVSASQSVFVCRNMECPDNYARCAPCHLKMVTDAPRSTRRKRDTH